MMARKSKEEKSKRKKRFFKISNKRRQQQKEKETHHHRRSIQTNGKIKNKLVFSIIKARRSSVAQSNLLHINNLNQNPNRNSSIVSNKNHENSQEVAKNLNESQIQKNQETFFKNIINVNHEKRELNYEDIKDELKISKALNEQILKKVIIIIMTILFSSVGFDFSTYDNNSTDAYLFITNYVTIDLANSTGRKSKFLTYVNENCDPNYPIINITFNNSLFYENTSYSNVEIRNDNILYSYSGDDHAIVFFSNEVVNFKQSLLNIFKTIFVSIILLVFSILFEGDTKRKILEPIELMMEIVHIVSQDPIKARNIEELNHGVKALIFNYEHKEEEKKHLKSKHMNNYEVMIIKSALVKISALLAIGFGEAGGEIIQENLKSSEFNPMIKGSKKVAIFGFCDIRKFAEINHILEEETLVFVNAISEVVHSCADTFGGSINKNLGDAFIAVWKLNDKDWIISRKLLKINSNSPHVQFQADQALLTYLSIIIKINTRKTIVKYSNSKRILEHIPDFRVNMGFGLHIGWAIEGAIGSIYKIDASYLSPNVNISARLEAASRQYGVYILMSGEVYDLLSPDLKLICRLIDIVTVKGSINPLRLYTVDVNTDLEISTSDKPQLNLKQKREKYAEKREKLLKKIKKEGSLINYILKKDKFEDLLSTDIPQQFYDLFTEGFDYYISGEWEVARKMFNDCLTVNPNEGPTKTLLNFMSKHNFKKPENWSGYRELTSK
jgi:class 3 adenylate cyclase